MVDLNRNDLCWCGSGKKFKKCHLGSAGIPRNRQEENREKADGMRRAGAFNGELMDYVRPFVRAGITTGEINSIVHEYTVKHGHTPACLGYLGYPKSVCTSTNSVVCHGIPSVKEVLRDGDIVNVDLTTIVDGWYGDSSETFFIGTVPEQTRHLVMVTAEALVRGIAAVKPGRPLSDIARAIEPFVKSNNCSVVRQYTGHGIGKKFHENFSVYHHIDSRCEAVIMEPGMTMTIEPMINLGGWEVTLDKKDGWTVRTKDNSLSAQFEHTVLVTGEGCEVLTLTPSQRAGNCLLTVDKRSFGAQ
ncbi:MAG: type I methionyl aminopeptidase [Chitinispirillaceae bacterium]|jgi:methionyl aminopeptidase|nr:type I methionyl aminopeptidase [Chitinispirillaceae bacterium]